MISNYVKFIFYQKETVKELGITKIVGGPTDSEKL